MRAVALVLFCALAGRAELPVTFGVKAGVVRNEQPGSRIVPVKGGAYAEVKLPKLPRIETGLMLERYETGSRGVAVYQVPVLLKKRFSGVAVRPFLSGGVTLRRLPAFEENYPGLTVAGGLTLGLLPVKLEPEVRFTRWLQSNYTPQSQQVEFLVGIRF